MQIFILNQTFVCLAQSAADPPSMQQGYPQQQNIPSQPYQNQGQKHSKVNLSGQKHLEILKLF